MLSSPESRDVHTQHLYKLIVFVYRSPAGESHCPENVPRSLQTVMSGRSIRTKKCHNQADILSNSQLQALHWLQKEIQLYLHIWENEHTSDLIYHLSSLLQYAMVFI